MKILTLNYEFPPIGGGAGKAHFNLLRQFSYNELEVDVLTSAPEPGFFVEEFANNIRLYKIGIYKKNLHYWRKTEVIEWLLKAQRHYHRLLWENDYDLAHAFFAFPSGWLCYRNAEKLPYIISLRGSDVPGYNVRLGLDYKILSGVFRKIWAGSAEMVANSEGLRKLALDFMPNLDIKVIPNGIDTEQFKPSDRQYPSRPLQLLTVCRLISRKRIDLLIKAVARAKQLGLDVRFNIAGEGNLMNWLKKLAIEIGASKEVIFMGRVEEDQMPKVYQNNDIFVMSSAHEGMSNAMLEAMASGLPIITTRCEGTDELIAGNGIIAENDDPESIASALKQLADNDKQYVKMTLAARKQAEKFSWETVAQQYLQCYKKALGKY